VGIIFLIILWVLFILAGAGLLVFGSSSNRDSIGGRAVGGILATAGGLALFLTFFVGGIQSVPVKSLGVPMAFGTVTGKEMGPGIHFTWEPWLNVVPVDETVQTTSFEGGNALPVRIGGQQSATADATIQWQILPQAASGLYQDYANQGNLMTAITDAVVVREFKQVVNQQVGDYNPITDVQNVSGSNSATSQFTSLSSQIQTQMQKDIGSRIRVISVFIPKLTYDQAVENALQSIQTANANYAIATENVKVNQEKAAAYAKLGTPTLAQLVAQCITEAGVNAGQCIPGATDKIALSGK
jgi:regulator of protease activity HflC (stomatin/prohibitin superfamily)